MLLILLLSYLLALYFILEFELFNDSITLSLALYFTSIFWLATNGTTYGGFGVYRIGFGVSIFGIITSGFII